MHILNSNYNSIEFFRAKIENWEGDLKREEGVFITLQFTEGSHSLNAGNQALGGEWV